MNKYILQFLDFEIWKKKYSRLSGRFCVFVFQIVDSYFCLFPAKGQDISEKADLKSKYFFIDSGNAGVNLQHFVYFLFFLLIALGFSENHCFSVWIVIQPSVILVWSLLLIVLTFFSVSKCLRKSLNHRQSLCLCQVWKRMFKPRGEFDT